MNRQKTGSRSKSRAYAPERDELPVKNRAGARRTDYDDFDDYDEALYAAKRPARASSARTAAPRSAAAKTSRPAKKSKASLPFGDDGYEEVRASRPVREPYDNRPIRKDRYQEARPVRHVREIDEDYPVRAARGYDEELPTRRRARAQSPRPNSDRRRRDEFYDYDEPTRRRKAPPRRKKKRDSSAVIWWLIAIVGALIIGFGLRTFGFELLTVSGDAMDGTLSPGQITLVEKAVYYGSKPARGDIIGVKAPEGMIIRRVVALPGESIEIKDGVTYVNGEPLEEKYVLKKGGGDYPLTTIPDGAYFVMCDNRLNTDDSRTFGLIRNTRSLIVGKVNYILWPMTDWGKIAR
jgi:signal peptidase I